MDTSEIQKRLDGLTAVMLSKGLRQAEANFQLKSHSDLCVGGSWKDDNRQYGSDFSYEHADTPEGAFTLFEDWLATQPDANQRKLNEFMEAVGKAVDIGRAHGIDADFVNPLAVLMKTLSENALTFRVSPAE